MNRREFITLLGGAAAAWPLAARAQQRERMRRIGVLMPAPRTIRKVRPASRRSCRACSNWAGPIGRNVRIDTRWAGGDADDIRKYAAELAALAPDVILAAWRVDCRTVAAGDPHRADRVRPCRSIRSAAGFVDSLARPGGNATGFMTVRIQHERRNGWSCSRRLHRA